MSVAASSVEDMSGWEVQRSFDELGRPLRDLTFCVVDLETTGGSAEGGSMITEIGAVKVRGGAAGRLEVDDAEGEVAQGSPQLVETALRLPAGRRTLDGAAHGLDARGGHRQSAGRRAE